MFSVGVNNQHGSSPAISASSDPAVSKLTPTGSFVGTPSANPSSSSSSKLPNALTFLDNRLPADYFKQDILKTIHKLKVHKLWKYVTPEMARDIVVERMSGALTNAVYMVAPPPYIKDIIKLSQNANIIGGIDQKTGHQVRFNPSYVPPSKVETSTTTATTNTKENVKPASRRSSVNIKEVLADAGAGPHEAYHKISSSVSSESGSSAYPGAIGGHSSSKSATKQPPKLLLRIYGPNAENLIDRDSELKVLARLSKRHIGPRLLGTFTNGRFEQFLEAKALTKAELRDPEVSVQIAKRMRELHDLIKLDEATERQKGPESFVSIKNWASPAEQKLMQLQAFSDTQTDATKLPRRHIVREILGVDTYEELQNVITRYQKWLQSQYAGLKKTGNLENVFNPIKDPKEFKIDENESKTGMDIIKKDLVFAHNDTQYGNLLRVLPPPGSPLLSPVFEHRQIIVIDFEYSGVNVRGFDISNHFCEWMSDYHDEAQPWKIHLDKFPTLEQRRNMIQGYVEHGYSTRSMSSTANSSPVLTATSLNSRSSLSNLNISSLSLNSTITPTNDKTGLGSSGSLNFDYFDDSAIDAEVMYLEKEAMAWRPICSAHWAIWGLVQATVDAKAEEKLRQERDQSEGYIFEEKNAGTAGSGATADEKVEGDAELEEAEEEEDLFDYVAYSKEKFKLFWGDMIKYGIVTKDEYKGPYSVIENDFK